jgi:hypothetical protein
MSSVTVDTEDRLRYENMTLKWLNYKMQHQLIEQQLQALMTNLDKEKRELSTLFKDKYDIELDKILKILEDGTVEVKQSDG